MVDKGILKTALPIAFVTSWRETFDWVIGH